LARVETMMVRIEEVSKLLTGMLVVAVGIELLI